MLRLMVVDIDAMKAFREFIYKNLAECPSVTETDAKLMYGAMTLMLSRIETNHTDLTRDGFKVVQGDA